MSNHEYEKPNSIKNAKRIKAFKFSFGGKTLCIDMLIFLSKKKIQAFYKR